MEIFAEQVTAEASGQNEPRRNWALELELLHRDGSVIPVEENVNFVRDHEGRPVGLLGVTRDGRERKKAEEELRASEERYRLLAENATDVIWITDMNHKFSYISPSAERFSGWTVDEAMGMTIQEMLTPESFESAMKIFAEHVAAEVREQSAPFLDWTAEVELRCKGGSTRWVEAKLNFLRDHEGRAVGVMGVGRDISDRKKAEEALRASEDRFRTVYQRSPVGIMIYDSTGLLVDMNDTAKEMFGVANVSEARAPLLLENPQLGEARERLLSGKTVRYEGPFDFDDVRRKGLYHTSRTGCAHLYVLLTPLGAQATQAPQNYLVIVQDVTDRKMAEEGLRQSEEKYRVLVESSPDAILSLDSRGRIIECNSALCDMAGYTWEELRQAGIDRLWPRKVLQGQSHQVQPDGTGLFETEIELIHRDGHGIPVWAKVVRPNGNEGDSGPTMVYMRDVAERKKAEDLKDEFIGLVSHELRSPLTVIVGAVNTALDEFHHLSRQELYQLLQDASAEAESLSHLLGNLLELSRAQANRLFLHVEPISIEKTVQKVVAKMRHISSPAHQLVIDIPKRLPPVQADELRLERILYNLLENSIKYSPQGGVIGVFARRENDQLTVGINDQGIGISLKDQSQLFKPFHQVGEAKQGVSTGAGLGLLVCRRLVEAHGGRIWVESKPRQGSTFSFTLPTGKRPARKRPRSK
jgi:PAS domain S-box-containing protein